MEYEYYKKVINLLVDAISKKEKTRERSIVITKLQEARLWLNEDKRIQSELMKNEIWKEMKERTSKSLTDKK